jgi:hypothetical protein
MIKIFLIPFLPNLLRPLSITSPPPKIWSPRAIVQIDKNTNALTGLTRQGVFLFLGELSPEGPKDHRKKQIRPTAMPMAPG